MENDGRVMVPPTQAASTLADLMRYDGQAELLGGKIVPIVAAGYRPGCAAGNIFFELHRYAEDRRRYAYMSKIGFAIPLLPSGRESFSPDASYYDGPLPADRMDFIAGPPTLAVEVRNQSDYGQAAEAEMAAKRTDYFQAGTKVVWDVDTVVAVVRKYQADAPDQPTLFVRGQEADAEPALPGWRMAVDRIFDV